MPEVASAPPSQTIYINNLNEKVKKEELKKALFGIFSQFGTILDIVALKTLKMRGQAFVVFQDISASTNALRQMQGFPFYEKPMRINFAKGKSNAVAKLDGSFVERPKAEKKKESKKRKKEPEDGEREEKRQAQHAPPPAAPSFGMPPPSMSMGLAAPPISAPGMPSVSMGLGPFGGIAIPPSSMHDTPNKILFVQNLPEQANEMMLSMLFQQFPGFREVRLVPGKSGIAFIEFDSETQATIALNGLQNFKITPTNLMQISYAKK